MKEQIEEMRKEVKSIHRFFMEDDDYEDLDEYIADELYNAGYRKQSENMVEVVRCKDCKWWEAWITGSTVGRCENPRNGLVNEYSEETDFCSYGERKE